MPWSICLDSCLVIHKTRLWTYIFNIDPRHILGCNPFRHVIHNHNIRWKHLWSIPYREESWFVPNVLFSRDERIDQSYHTSLGTYAWRKHILHLCSLCSSVKLHSQIEYIYYNSMFKTSCKKAEKPCGEASYLTVTSSLITLLYSGRYYICYSHQVPLHSRPSQTYGYRTGHHTWLRITGWHATFDIISHFDMLTCHFWSVPLSHVTCLIFTFASALWFHPLLPHSDFVLTCSTFVIIVIWLSILCFTHGMIFWYFSCFLFSYLCSRHEHSHTSMRAKLWFSLSPNAGLGVIPYEAGLSQRH